MIFVPMKGNRISLNRPMNNLVDIPNSIVDNVMMVLADNDYEILSERIIQHGYQIKTTTGVVINMYKTGTILLQGQKDDKLKSLLKL